MRKKIIGPQQKTSTAFDQDWLNLEHIAEVEMTSEDAAHPIESALLPNRTTGWRAAGPGQQTIRILFSAPQRLQRVFLSFVETQIERTHEYVLRWSPDNGKSFQEIVRQQWNFSPNGTSSETGDYRVDLSGVTQLELNIIPNISGGNAIASLLQLRLA